MKEMAYFELFGRISDRFVTEALIPAVIPIPAPKRGFRQTPLGRFLASPAFIATMSAVAAVAVAVAVGLGLAGQGRDPGADTGTPSETLWESADESRDTDSDGESETVDDWDQDHPYIQRKNYDSSLGIIYGLDRMGEDFSYLSPEMVFAGATALNADIHERIQHTEEYLGVRIGFIPEENDDGVMYKAGSMSGSWENDNYIFIASGEAVARLGAGDSRYMTAWDTLDAINTEADYWDGELLRTHTQNGHSYMAYNSFIPPNAYAIVYNKALYATAPVQRDLYSLVESGDWTVDTLLSILSETADINGRLAVRELETISPYLTGVGFRVTDTRQTEVGTTQVFNMSDRQDTLKPLYGKILELVTAGPAFHWDRQSDPATFIENGEILMDTRLTRDLTEKAYGKPIGVLPMPKYDQAQSEYRSLHVNAYMGLWCNQDNKQMCGEVVELLAYFSRNSEETYNRAVMGVYGKDASAVRKDLAMLRIIHNTTHDVGLTLSMLSPSFLPPLLNGQSELTANEQKTLSYQFRIAQRLTSWEYVAPEA